MWPSFKWDNNYVFGWGTKGVGGGDPISKGVWVRGIEDRVHPLTRILSEYTTKSRTPLSLRNEGTMWDEGREKQPRCGRRGRIARPDAGGVVGSSRATGVVGQPHTGGQAVGGDSVPTSELKVWVARCAAALAVRWDGRRKE